MKEIMVAITKIGNLRTTSTGKNIVDISVKQLDTGKFLNVACFVDENGFPYNIGDEVTMGLTASQYQGKWQYSTGLKSIAPVIKKEKEVPKEVPNEVWESKDRRMARMNSLAHAVEIFKVSKENKEEGYNTIVECVKDIAGQLEAWIYNGMEEEPLEEPEEPFFS